MSISTDQNVPNNEHTMKFKQDSIFMRLQSIPLLLYTEINKLQSNLQLQSVILSRETSALMKLPPPRHPSVLEN